MNHRLSEELGLTLMPDENLMLKEKPLKTLRCAGPDCSVITAVVLLLGLHPSIHLIGKKTVLAGCFRPAGTPAGPGPTPRSSPHMHIPSKRRRPEGDLIR